MYDPNPRGPALEWALRPDRPYVELLWSGEFADYVVRCRDGTLALARIDQVWRMADGSTAYQLTYRHEDTMWESLGGTYYWDDDAIRKLRGWDHLARPCQPLWWPEL